jgi:hypothetical protein
MIATSGWSDDQPICIYICSYIPVELKPKLSSFFLAVVVGRWTGASSGILILRTL